MRGLLKKIKHLAIVGSIALPYGLGMPAQAQVMTAGVIDAKMTSSEWNAYVSGIVEGLAQARYLRDGKKPAGRTCIRQWWEEEVALDKVSAAFKRHPNAMPAEIVSTLIAVKCGA